MNVKGFIIEDDQGRECVLVCEPPYADLGKTYQLRGWQRRRLVPLQYTEREYRQIVAEVLLTLNDLYANLPRFVGDMDEGSSGKTTSTVHVVSAVMEDEDDRLMH